MFRQLINMQQFDSLISGSLLQRIPAVANLYILEGFDFAQQDIASQSDPFLKITCGNSIYNERDNYQLNNNCPKFDKHYEFNVEFPGPPNIVIEAFDFDDIFGDDLIGTTTIDLDDRYYSVDW